MEDSSNAQAIEQYQNSRLIRKRQPGSASTAQALRAQRRSPSPAISSTEDQERIIRRMILENGEMRQYWRNGMALLCGLLVGTCLWLAVSHINAPFKGPAMHFAPLAMIAIASDVTVALGCVIFALIVQGIGSLLGIPRGNYIAIIISIVPLLQFGVLFADHPAALAVCWPVLWLPLLVPVCAGMAAYFEATFADINAEIAGLLSLRYNAQTA
jgi:hypothetical protein